MTTASFSHLKKHEVSADQTADYVFYEIAGEPTLTVAPATPANKRYNSEMTKRNLPLYKRVRAAGDSAMAKAAEDIRDTDRDLYAKHVIKGWSNVFDADGNEAKFNKENCAAFLEALPDYMFDMLRDFASNNSSFVSLDSEDAAKN